MMYTAPKAEPNNMVGVLAVHCFNGLAVISKAPLAPDKKAGGLSPKAQAAGATPRAFQRALLIAYHIQFYRMILAIVPPGMHERRGLLLASARVQQLSTVHNIADPGVNALCCNVQVHFSFGTSNPCGLSIRFSRFLLPTALKMCRSLSRPVSP